MENIYKYSLEEAISHSELPKLLAKYDKFSVLYAASFSDYGYFSDMELLLIISNHVKWGSERIDNKEEIDHILAEVARLKYGISPFTQDALVNTLRNIRSFRPLWVTIPFYIDILKPFDKEIKNIYKFGVEELFNSIPIALKRVTDKGIIPEYPDPYAEILSRLSVNIQELKEWGDIWDKAFVVLENGYIITIQYKVPEVLYRSICRELVTNKKFNYRKGQSMENVIKNDLKYNFQDSTLLLRSCLPGQNRGDLDILLLRESYAFVIESKSLVFRNKSVDYSILNARSDLIPIIKGITQLAPYLDLLSIGGTLAEKNGSKRTQISKKSALIGAIITDNLYTGLVLEPVYKEAMKNKIALDVLKKYPVWIGSLFDFNFLLSVSRTPSILIHYITKFRAKRFAYLLDESDSWYVYSQFPEDSRAFNMIDTWLMPSDYLWTEDWWNLLRQRKFNLITPIWLKYEIDHLITLDENNLTEDALSIIDEKWKEAINEFYETRHNRVYKFRDATSK